MTRYDVSRNSCSGSIMYLLNLKDSRKQVVNNHIGIPFKRACFHNSVWSSFDPWSTQLQLLGAAKNFKVWAKTTYTNEIFRLLRTTRNITNSKYYKARFNLYLKISRVMLIWVKMGSLEVSDGKFQCFETLCFGYTDHHVYRI